MSPKHSAFPLNLDVFGGTHSSWKTLMSFVDSVFLGGTQCPWGIPMSLEDPSVPGGSRCLWWTLRPGSPGRTQCFWRIQVSFEDPCVLEESNIPKWILVSLWVPLSLVNPGIPGGSWCPMVDPSVPCRYRCP